MTTRASVRGARALVVGGAGFVGGNLVRALVRRGATSVVVVDNLLSSNRTDVLELPGVKFVQGSIASPRVLAGLDDDFDLAFHLATFHGNQNSMADPLADHRNNLETTLRLYERLSGFTRLQKVVYASAGCTMARKVYGSAEPTKEDDPISLDLDSPYQISKIVGEMYGNYFHERAGLPVVHARFQNVYGPGEILGAGRWRGTRGHGVAQRDAHLHLSGDRGPATHPREPGEVVPGLHLRRGHRRRAAPMRDAR